MKRMPLLTSGRGLLGRGLTSPPYRDDGSDWAEIVVVEVTDDEATLLGTYWQSGYQGFLRTGDVGRLTPFEGVVVGGFPVVVDPGLIEDFDAEFGYVDVRELYDSSGSNDG